MESLSSDPRRSVFDYVIVGSGPSAMGVLYGLLEDYTVDIDDETKGNPTAHTRTPNFSIAILERGYGPPHDVITSIPHRWYEAAHNTRSDSVRHYRSNITGRVLDLPVGQGLGGSSNINACICTPPLAQDLEIWPEPWKSNLLPNAKALQQKLQQNHALLYGAKRSSIGSDIVYEGKRISSPFRDNSPGLELSSPIPTLTSFDYDSSTNQQHQREKVVRQNYFSSLLEPLLTQSPHLMEQLHWFRGCEVQRLLLDDEKKRKQVVGVEYSRGQNRTWELFATKRIILCAGAIESPALLLVSHLSAEYDPELSGVGKHLQDQTILPRSFWKLPAGAGPIPVRSTNGIAALGHFNLQVPEGVEQKRCNFQVTVNDSVSNSSILPAVFAMTFRWECSNTWWIRTVDMMCQLLETLARLLILCSPLGIILHHCTVSTLLCMMHPYSYGSVTIRFKHQRTNGSEETRRRDVTVLADPGYLNDPRDCMMFKEAWDATGYLVRSGSLEAFPSFLFSILKPFDIDYDRFQSFARYFLLPYYHFSGTCAMQLSTDQSTSDNTEWVVDSTSLKLRGYGGLSVCDASVFPSMISNPPALTCVALGYTFGKRLLIENDKTHTNSSSDSTIYPQPGNTHTT
jgi:choline dehydrogenase-like flavoprotein